MADSKNPAGEIKMLFKYSHMKYRNCLHYDFIVCPCTCARYIVPLPPIILKLFSLTLAPTLLFLHQTTSHTLDSDKLS